MDLTQLANLGEFIGGVAVLVTLIYLAVQVRQGNQLVRSQVQQEFSRMSSEVASKIDRDDIELFLQGANDVSQVSGADRMMVVVRSIGILNFYETLLFARQRGEVGDAVWVSRVQRLRNVFVFFAPLWNSQMSSFSEEFWEFVDREVIPMLDSKLASAGQGQP